MTTVACIVPARAGSRRIRDKNLERVGARSLLERAVDVAIAACGSVLVSTDDERYAEHALAAGATVPGLRPAALATDTATTDDVVHHALISWCDPEVEIVVVLQPTSPFTVAADVAGVIEALLAGGAETALTGVRLPPTHAYALVGSDDGLARFIDGSMLGRRTQELPPLHIPSGGVYAAPAARLRAGGRLVVEPVAVVEVPAERAIDIDDPADLDEARRVAAG